MIAWIVNRFYQKNGVKWDQNSKTAALLMASMLISPYTSRQSMIAALVFAPSIGSYVLQWFLLALLPISQMGYPFLGHSWAPLVFFSTLITYSVFKRKHGISQSGRAGDP